MSESWKNLEFYKFVIDFFGKKLLGKNGLNEYLPIVRKRFSTNFAQPFVLNGCKKPVQKANKLM